MEQGKKESQLKDAETFAFIALMIILLTFIIIGLISCNNTKAQNNKDITYIMIDGQEVEMVVDKGDNPYLKYKIGETDVFIPFPFETQDESDTLIFYNTKNK